MPVSESILVFSSQKKIINYTCQLVWESGKHYLHERLSLWIVVGHVKTHYKTAEFPSVGQEYSTRAQSASLATGFFFLIFLLLLFLIDAKLWTFTERYVELQFFRESVSIQKSIRSIAIELIHVGYCSKAHYKAIYTSIIWVKNTSWLEGVDLQNEEVGLD